MKKKQEKSTALPADILKVYQQLNLLQFASIPYDRDAQMRMLKKVSLFTDNNRYYASGDTRTDR